MNNIIRRIEKLERRSPSKPKSFGVIYRDNNGDFHLESKTGPILSQEELMALEQTYDVIFRVIYHDMSEKENRDV